MHCRTSNIQQYFHKQNRLKIFTKKKITHRNPQKSLSKPQNIPSQKYHSTNCSNMSTNRVYSCFWVGCFYTCPKKSGIGRHSAQCELKPENKEEFLRIFNEKKTKVFLCEECEAAGVLRAFGRPSDLTSHRKRHYKEALPPEEYQSCQYCDYKTIDKSNFRTHQKTCKDPNLGLRSGKKK